MGENTYQKKPKKKVEIKSKGHFKTRSFILTMACIARREEEREDRGEEREGEDRGGERRGQDRGGERRGEDIRRAISLPNFLVIHFFFPFFSYDSKSILLSLGLSLSFLFQRSLAAFSLWPWRRSGGD